jgi:REP element-mobilizing transposase RayT
LNPTTTRQGVQNNGYLSLLKGILARTQRDSKVILTNFVEMINHAHQHVIPDQPQMQVKFYMEYQKKITDTVRKLTKRKRLRLWEERPSVCMVAQLQDAINRMSYMFLNPTRAGLVERIEDYPGLNTWEAFTTCPPSVDAEVVIKAVWTPVSTLEPLPENNRLSTAQDKAMARRLAESEDGVPYDLIVKPLAWLKVYGITDPEQIEAIRQHIIKEVRRGEAELVRERREAGRGIMGAERLKQQSYLRSHTPKKKERRIFVICGDDALRPRIIAAIKNIFRRCRECYIRLKEGLPHEWPPGTFIPWIPPKECRSPYMAALC